MTPTARILVIDAGTTGIRALVYDENTTILAQAYTEFPQYHPGPDRVEQDGNEIWRPPGRCSRRRWIPPACRRPT